MRALHNTNNIMPNVIPYYLKNNLICVCVCVCVNIVLYICVYMCIAQNAPPFNFFLKQQGPYIEVVLF